MKKNNGYIPKIGERVEFACHFIPQANSLLDIGCGDGVISYFIKNKVKIIYGIDNDATTLKKAEKRGISVKKANLDTDKIPYQKNFFNVVTCLDVIEHVKNPEALISNIYEILSSNGMLIISTPNIRFIDHLKRLLVFGTFPKTSYDINLYDGGHIHFFTYKDLENILTEQGFEVIKKEGIINKNKRGWKGSFLEFILGKKTMNEFFSPGILLVAQKV